MMNKKVNFFIVGQPKSGTTSLYKYLNQHPDIFFLNNKEPHIFCKDFHKSSDKFYRKQKYFEYREKSCIKNLMKGYNNQKIIAEATTNYLFSKTSAKEIYNYNKDSKILIILRNPFDYLESLHSYYYTKFIDNNSDINISLEDQKFRKQLKRIPFGVKCPDFLLYSNRVRYYEQIKRYYDLFDENNIKIILYEEFKSNNSKYLREVLEFLNLKSSSEIDLSSKANTSKSYKFSIINKISNSKIFLSVIRKIPMEWKRPLYNLLVKKAQKSKINEENRKKIKKAIKNDMQKLERFVKKDLMDFWDLD